MPDSENRPIEKLLRSAAAKRRAQAGFPEMHRATRETLLTAVKRHYGHRDTRASSGKAWWWRLAPALGVVAVVAVGSWAILRKGAEEPLELAKFEPDNALRQIAAPAPAPVANDQVRAADRATLAETRADTEALSPPASIRMDRVTPAPSPTQAARSASDELKRNEPAQPLAAAAVMAEGSLATASSSPLPVLQNFVVTQTGRRVRFIDADGSTYEGDLQPVGTESEELRIAGVSRESSDGAALTGAQTTLVAVPEPHPELMTYDFKAEGLNRSLQQQVRFAGNLVLTEEQLRLGQNAFSNTLTPALQQSVHKPLPESQTASPGRVQGTFQIGEGSSLRVDAVPAHPPD